jgi:hypothetical protein
MTARKTLEEGIGLPREEMDALLQIFLTKAADIKPNDNREQKLAELRNEADSYFIAEMDSRHEGRQPIADQHLYELVDQLLIEIGIKGMPPRRRPLRKPPWQIAN